ncbi:MAG: beta-eliminating lyase-related protein [Collinsella sp.]
MLAFNNDYSHGAHPAVLQALVDTNMEPQPGYGTDAHTERAKQLIREACQAPDADVFFLVGGTQANATVIDMLLAPYEGVVAAETGHVACHEAGAIEFGGHKVLTIPGYEGKMHAEDLENYIQVFYETKLRAHGVPGRRVRESIDRVRHAVLQGRARGDSRGMPEARDSAVCGRCSPGLCAGGR